MKLRVLPSKFLHEEINGRMRHFEAGTVFEHPDEKRAKRLLEITPAVVVEASDEPVVDKKNQVETDQKPAKPGKGAKGV